MVRAIAQREASRASSAVAATQASVTALGRRLGGGGMGDERVFEARDEDLQGGDAFLQRGLRRGDVGDRRGPVLLEQRGLQVAVEQALRADHHLQAALNIGEPLGDAVLGGRGAERNQLALPSARVNAELGQAGLKRLRDGRVKACRPDPMPLRARSSRSSSATASATTCSARRSSTVSGSAQPGVQAQPRAAVAVMAST